MIRVFRVAVVLATICALAGCISAPRQGTGPSLYMLDSGPAPASGSPQADAPTLMIAPVNAAPYLTQGGIVYQTAPNRVVVANDNRWASALPGQLSDTLYNVLSARLSPVNVRRASSDQRGLYKLETRVERFYGSHDGSAHIAGQWQLVSPSGQILRSENFQHAIPLTRDGYPALVASLSEGWQDVVGDMAPPLSTSLRRAGASAD